MTNRNEKGIDMDNEKEVKRTPTEIAAQLWCLPRHSHKQMDVLLCEDIAKALSAERTKREEAENEIDLLKKDNNGINFVLRGHIQKNEDKIKELEALLQQERKLKSEYKAGMDKRWGEKLELEAKVKELETDLLKYREANDSTGVVSHVKTLCGSVDEFIKYHHNPIVLDKNRDILKLEKEIEEIRQTILKENTLDCDKESDKNLNLRQLVSKLCNALFWRNNQIDDLKIELAATTKHNNEIENILFCGDSKDDRRFYIQKIAVANAKIVELEKEIQAKNNEDSTQPNTIKENLSYFVSMILNAHAARALGREPMDFPSMGNEEATLKIIKKFESELSTANKKAEKLVEALEWYANENNYADCVPFHTRDNGILDEPQREADCGYTAIEALKEYRGGE